MGKIALVFSGQGDQFTGMGKDLCRQYPASRAVFDMCDELRPGTSLQCFEGSEQELRETMHTQPCMFAMELAALEALHCEGIQYHAVAGFSLGEVVAAVAAGLVDAKTGFRLVCRRGQIMQEALEGVDTFMAAVLRLSSEQVERICASFEQVFPVNYNCPGQITVAGVAETLAPFGDAVKAAGGRVVPLKVKGAFHSPFMINAAQIYEHELSTVEFARPGIPLYSNLTAEPYGSNPAQLLGRQMCSPVKWEQTIRNMIAEGVDTFIEIGPGKTLTNMIGKIDGQVRRYAVADMDTLLLEVRTC